MSPAKKQTTALRATLATLAALPIERLKAQFETAFNKAPGRLGRDQMIKRLSERATGPAQDAAAAPATPTKAARTPGPAKARDPRLPAPGGTIEKVFKGKSIKVEVTADGFRHAGKDWASLTALALSITGYGAISGPAFFGLTAPAKAARTAKPKAKGN